MRQGLEIPLVLGRLTDLVYDTQRTEGGARKAPRHLMSRTPARAVESHKMRTDIDMNVIHVAVCHHAARVMIGDEPTDHLRLFARSAKIDRLA